MFIQLLLSSLAILSSLHPDPRFVHAIPTVNGTTANGQQDDYEQPPNKIALVRVDPSKTFQIFDGMGFAEAFRRCKIIYGSDGLSPANTEKVLDLLFSNTTGAGLTILRNGIGSASKFMYDWMVSIAPTSPGASGAEMTYQWDGDDNGQVKMTKDALARGAKMIYADAWSAPGYMKNNNNDSGGGSLCGVRNVTCASGDWRKPFAEYLVQYLKYYKQEGITIDHVGFLNEPEQNTTYASMLSTGEEAADFLKILYPILQASGLSTTIGCCDGEGWEGTREQLAGLQKEGAEDTLGIVTTHGYTSSPGAPFNTTKRVWQTEWADLMSPTTQAWYNSGSPGEGFTWAVNIHNAFVNSNVSAFLYWIGAGGTTTNSALILLHKDEVIVSKRLWAFAQYSRLIRPGARRIDATVVGISASSLRSSNKSPTTLVPRYAQPPQAELYASAFMNPDSSIVIHVINNSDVAICVDVQGVDTKKRIVTRYLTNEANDFTKMNSSSMAGGGCDMEVGGLIEKRSMMGITVGMT
ncbi:hypothetical protein FKW77_004531 [Venturia effusa]|uniref:Uncharacterized protein n=1 Tax=Venturia effusa TaxID=50376 RepID=A0A517L954_9PEZI|nr:hypothetical protein FKW77_004531 [Venturia effusa]